MRALAAALAWLLASCAPATTWPSPPADGPLIGRWGGQHVALDLTASGGALDYDCAAGTIDQPLVPAADGRFSAAGTHSPGHGGPEQIGEVHPKFAARYSGAVRGDAMTLTVTVDNGVLIGPLELRRGAEPMLTRCL